MGKRQCLAETEKDELNNRDKSCKGTIVLHASQSNARSISLKDHCMELTTSKGESLIFAAQDSFSYDTVKKLYSMLFSDLFELYGSESKVWEKLEEAIYLYKQKNKTVDDFRL